MFDSITELPANAFDRDAPILPCIVDGQEVARIAIDRSDAKITIRSIRNAACIRHAEWTT